MPIIQQMGIDAQLVMKALDGLDLNESITYAELTATIKRSVTQNRSILETARRALLRDKNKLFCCIRGEGLQRVDDLQKIDVASTNLGRVRKIVSKSRKILSSVDNFDQLPNESKIKHNAVMSLCGVIQQCSKSTSITKIEQRLQNNNHIMPVAETFELFSK